MLPIKSTTMYFGTPNEIKELKGRVFLTPHIGIASLFIINKEELPIESRGYSFNIGYRQWLFPNEKLQKPLSAVNMIHNIRELSDQVLTGQSKGYIYAIDINDIKDELSLFVTNDPDREVIYNGGKPLKIMECITHTLDWDFTFDQEEENKHGLAVKSYFN